MKKVMFFPGYGSQNVGMAKDIYDEFRVVQEYFEEASNCLDTNFVKICFASSESELSQIRIAYPSIFLVSCSIYALLKERGILPDMVVGYNIGSFSALSSAGSITFPDGLYVLNKYAQLYQEYIDNNSYALLSVQGLERDGLEQKCSKFSVTIAAFLSLDYAIISGYEKDIISFKEEMCGKKVKCKNVNLGMGLHSEQMRSVCDQLTTYLPMIDFKAPTLPYLGYDQRMIMSSSQVKDSTIEGLSHTIEWHAIMEAVAEYDMIIQVGPGSELGILAKKQYPDKLVITVQTIRDIEQLEALLINKELSMENN